MTFVLDELSKHIEECLVIDREVDKVMAEISCNRHKRSFGASSAVS